jgi:hypothetical protein
MARIATRVTGEAQAGGWAMLLAIASPGFSGLALSYFAMTAHLVFSLLYAWLLIERGSRGAFAAGLVGSFALLLHNPVPHILFSLPWIAWLAFQPEGRRNLAWLALGYLPGLAIGFAWAVFMKNMHGPIFAAPFPQDGELAHQIGNFVWYWDFRSRTMFSAPYEYSIQGRIGEQVRLWAWTVPGLPILAAGTTQPPSQPARAFARIDPRWLHLRSLRSGVRLGRALRPSCLWRADDSRRGRNRALAETVDRRCCIARLGRVRGTA